MSFSVILEEPTGIWARPCYSLSVLIMELFISIKNLSSNNKVL